jgi:hypothetical protein
MTVQHSRSSHFKEKALVSLLWLFFIFLWYRVSSNSSRQEFTDSLSYLGSMVSAYGVLVTVWVLHNIRIFRKKGPRLGRRQVSVSRTHDYLNQQITKMVNIQQEQEIIVEVSGGQKFFLARPAVAYGPIASGGGR